MTLLDWLVVRLAFIFIDYSCGHQAGFSRERLGHHLQHKACQTLQKQKGGGIILPVPRTQVTVKQIE